MWWWNSGAKDEIQKRKDAHKEMKNEYRKLKKAAKKAVAGVVEEEEAERKMNALGGDLDNLLRLVRKMKI